MSEECTGEQIEGAWATHGCTCERCLDYEDELIVNDNEAGYISDAEARARHISIDWLRDDKD